MAGKILSNKPLIEAIFELRWDLVETPAGGRADPHYRMLIGRLYDKVGAEYPFHEQLPTAAMPDEIAEYVVQHRFRKDKDQWPLVQLGPGIITVNDTDAYTWQDFEQRIIRALEAFFAIYPQAEEDLRVSQLLLRYIDGIRLDYEKNRVFDFLRDNLKIGVEVHKQLFDDTGVASVPLGLDLRFAFPSTKPAGAVHLRFVRGRHRDEDALIWETMVQSIGPDVPDSKPEIPKWPAEAHRLTHDWFFKLIEGDLERRFE